MPDSQPSDLVVINTCGFIDAARRESIGVIEEMLERKRSGQVKGVIVAGCLAERQKERLLEQFPEVDHVVGVFGREEIARVADRLLGGLNEQREAVPARADPGPGRPRPAADHPARTWPTSRSPRGATGSARSARSRSCAASTSPSRSRWSSPRPRSWPRDGVRELVLVAQDMTYYGLDLYGRPRLAELSERDRPGRGDRLDPHPLLLSPVLHRRALRRPGPTSKKIIPYLDMPLQHINDRMLKQMNRRHNRQETETIIARLRATIPGLVLRTTIIVGFPGETEAEFAELDEFVAATRFERLGAFTYSLEPDTPAAKLPDHLPDRGQGGASRPR